MKVLAWNIKFFSKNRIVGQTETRHNALYNKLVTRNDALRASATLTFILFTVRNTDPDVFVVVEPRANAGQPGTLADSDSGGPAGLIYLLAQLREMHSDKWSLVPPQRINSTRTDPINKSSQYTECIGVFWRTDRMQFTGPWHYTTGGDIRPVGVGTASNYPDPWDKVVPPDTKLAGQCLFPADGETFRGFPDDTSRKPLRTTFNVLDGTGRMLELFSVHLDTYQGARAVDNLVSLPYADAANKVIMIAGDFNVDVSAADGKGFVALNNLSFRNAGFGRLYPGPYQDYINRFPQFQPTSCYPGNEATWAAYKIATTYDFAMVHLGKNAGDIDQSKCQAVDRVAGTPPGAGVAIMTPLRFFTNTNDDQQLTAFRSRENYGRIGTPAFIPDSPTMLADGTSDHLPILVTVP
jgi:hypothetical protein